MKTRLAAAAAAMLFSSAIVAPASAASLNLDYSVTPKAGNVYHYDFTLRLDNQDGSWSPGQQWDWIIFGDVGYPETSPLAGFFNFSSPDPQATLTTSGGGHNGPTIAYEPDFVTLPGWQPTAVGDTLKWSGDAFTNLGSGQLLFSTLVWSDGASRSDFQVANLVAGSGVPEPATWGLMILGFGAVGGALRRRHSVTAKVRFA